MKGEKASDRRDCFYQGVEIANCEPRLLAEVFDVPVKKEQAEAAAICVRLGLRLRAQS